MPFLKTRHGRWRGLGTVATPVSGSLVYGSNPIGRAWGGNPPRRIVTVPSPVAGSGILTNPASPIRMQPCPAWGCNGPQTPINWYGGPGTASPGGGGSSSNGNALAIAQALLATNPGLLTQAQWTLLQQAGLVAGTLPYGSAGQVTTSDIANPSTVAATPAPTSSVDIGAALNTDYAGMPLWAWLGAGLGAYFLFNRQGGRR